MRLDLVTLPCFISTAPESDRQGTAWTGWMAFRPNFLRSLPAIFPVPEFNVRAAGTWRFAVVPEEQYCLGGCRCRIGILEIINSCEPRHDPTSNPWDLRCTRLPVRSLIKTGRCRMQPLQTLYVRGEAHGNRQIQIGPATPVDQKPFCVAKVPKSRSRQAEIAAMPDFLYIKCYKA